MTKRPQLLTTKNFHRISKTLINIKIDMMITTRLNNLRFCPLDLQELNAFSVQNVLVVSSFPPYSTNPFMLCRVSKPHANSAMLQVQLPRLPPVTRNK